MIWYIAVFEVLARWAIQSTFLLSVAGLAVVCLREPVKRLRVIQVAFVVCLALPLLTLVEMPAGFSWGWPWPAPSYVSSASPPPANVGPGLRPAVSENLSADAVPTLDPSGEFADVVQPTLTRPTIGELVFDEDVMPIPTGTPDVNEAGPQQHHAAPFWRDLRFVCVVGYLAGVVLMTLWWCAGRVALARLVRRSRLADERCQTMLRQVSADRAANVRLLCSREAQQPFMFGWRQPVILLPETVATGDDASLRWSLAHEWSHAARGDSRWWSLAGLIRVAQFYQPLVWWLRGQMRLSQDYLADTDASACGSAAEDYAQFLTEWAARADASAVSFGLGIFGRKSELYRRITMLVQNRRVLDRRCSRRWTVVAACLALGLVGVVATYCGSAAEPLQAPQIKVTITKDKDATIEVATANESEPQRERLRYADRTFDQWRDQLLNDLDPNTCLKAMPAIVAFGKKGYADEAVAALAQVLHGENSQVVSNAANSLREIGVAAIPALIGGLTDEHPEVRSNSAGALGRLGQQARAAIEPLQKSLNDTRMPDAPWVRNAMITALASIAGNDEYLQPTFEQILAKGTTPERTALEYGLAQLPRPIKGSALHLLLRLAADDDVQIRTDTVGVLVSRAPAEKKVIDAIKLLLRDLHQEVSAWTVDQLLGQNANTAISVVVLADALLADEVRQNHQLQARMSSAIELFGHANAKEQAEVTVPALIAVLEGKITGTGISEVHVAIEALGKLGPGAKPAVPALERLTALNKDDPDLFTASAPPHNEFTAKFAERALRKIGKSDSRQPATKEH